MKSKGKVFRLLLVFALVFANAFPALSHLANAQVTATQQSAAAPALPRGAQPSFRCPGPFWQ
jgi:hypothetical protein